MKPSRPLLIQITSALALVTIVLLGLSMTGCKSKSSPTPTPTKTPTTVPSITPTPTFQTPTIVAQVTSTPTFSPPTPTPTPTDDPIASEEKRTENVKVVATTPTPTSTTVTTAVEPAVTTAEEPTEERDATPTPTPQAAHTVAPTPVSVVMAADINPLTGLRGDAAKLNRRPLAIKIPNFPVVARPQSGLSLADVVIEHEAEAYLTRFTAIFMGNDAGLVGPIRSLRLIEAELMSIFKSTLVASGGHPAVKVRITQGHPWAAGYKRVICPEAPFLGDGGTGYRLPDKKPRHELTWYSDTPSLWNLCTQRGINQRQDFHSMFVFSETPPGGGADATHLKIVYKPTYSEAEYRYDAASHTYKRFDLGEPTTDELTGRQIAPPNVVVLYVNHVNSDILADTHDPDHPWYSVLIQLWGQGPAKLLRDGKVYDCTWMRENPQKDDDRLIFVDAGGVQIPFRPGPTWIQLVRLDGNVTID
jgi:hypothetical protein